MSKKRANGEGSIRKRKDGRWEGRYSDLLYAAAISPSKKLLKRSKPHYDYLHGCTIFQTHIDNQGISPFGSSQFCC